MRVAAIRGGQRPGADRKAPSEHAKGIKQHVVMTALSPDLMAQLDRHAVEAGKTRAAAIRDILSAFLADNDHQPPVPAVPAPIPLCVSRQAQAHIAAFKPRCCPPAKPTSSLPAVAFEIERDKNAKKCGCVEITLGEKLKMACKKSKTGYGMNSLSCKKLRPGSVFEKII